MNVIASFQVSDHNYMPDVHQKIVSIYLILLLHLVRCCRKA